MISTGTEVPHASDCDSGEFNMRDASHNILYMAFMPTMAKQMILNCHKPINVLEQHFSKFMGLQHLILTPEALKLDLVSNQTGLRTNVSLPGFVPALRTLTI